MTAEEYKVLRDNPAADKMPIVFLHYILSGGILPNMEMFKPFFLRWLSRLPEPIRSNTPFGFIVMECERKLNIYFKL